MATFGKKAVELIKEVALADQAMLPVYNASLSWHAGCAG
jgi:hypothetical protein